MRVIFFIFYIQYIKKIFFFLKNKKNKSSFHIFFFHTNFQSIIMGSASDYIYLKRISRSVRDSVKKSSDLTDRKVLKTMYCDPTHIDPYTRESVDGATLYDIVLPDLTECIDTNYDVVRSSSFAGLRYQTPVYNKTSSEKTCTKYAMTPKGIQRTITCVRYTK